GVEHTPPAAPPTHDFTAHPVVFFDGVCGLCNASVDYILARDVAGVFRFAPLQGTTAGGRLQPSDIADLSSLVLVDGQGIHRRSTAVWRILWRLRGGQQIGRASCRERVWIPVVAVACKESAIGRPRRT